MPFGMIFSIILIVVFLAVAGIVVKHFLGLQKCSEIGFFMRDFQTSVDKVWKSSSRSETFTSTLPGGIKEVCFVNFNESFSPAMEEKYGSVERRYGFYNPNFFFFPPEGACEIQYTTFQHLNITSVVEERNPYCITNGDGGIEIKISKDFNEALPKIE